MLKHTLSTHCCERDCCSPQFPKEMLECRIWIPTEAMKLLEKEGVFKGFFFIVGKCGKRYTEMNYSAFLIFSSSSDLRLSRCANCSFFL